LIITKSILSSGILTPMEGNVLSINKITFSFIASY